MPSANTIVSSLVLNIANIILLFLILRRLLYKPVKKFMTARSEAISGQISEAETKLAQAETMRQECADALAASTEAADTEKRRILDAAESKAAEITAAAEAQAERMKDSAAVAAQHAEDQMLEEMRDRIADLSVEIASKILEREVSRCDNADIVDKFFDRVG